MSFLPMVVCRIAPTCPPSREKSAASVVGPAAAPEALPVLLLLLLMLLLRIPMDWESRATALSISRQISSLATGFDAISGLDCRCCNSCYRINKK